MTKLHQLAELGQAIWLDYIQRSMIEAGELQGWIDQGLRGVTSNPSIFEKAIVNSSDYDRDLDELVAEGRSAPAIYEALVLEDIANAADLLRPVYERTEGLDGYVSLEARPSLAHDAPGTIAEIQHFHQVLHRPNVMFKVPATPEGMAAIEALIAAGINVNVTLIFSLAQYEAVAAAYMSGLEKLAASGGDVSQVASVASFFVSRIDTAVDRLLQERGVPDLQGKAAIASAKAAYDRFQTIVQSERWCRLAAKGARVQRLLWGSTSTKNPSYPDTMYVDGLIGPQTVNTVPPDTLHRFLEHGKVERTLDVGLEEAHQQLERLRDLGIDLDQVTQKLLDDGVAAFAKAFDDLMQSIAGKRARLLAGWAKVIAQLGDYQPKVDQALKKLGMERIVERIWAHDHTVWKDKPDEITNRLGWLKVAEAMRYNIPCLEALAQDMHAEGYTHAVLLGMGGSSLAPEVLSKIFYSPSGLSLAVLDSTDPAAVRELAQRLDPAHTLFIVSTKSGSTIETLSFWKFFYNWVADALGYERAGKHFVAITDPGSGLAALAEEYDFRAIFLNDANIGGRYSALSYFGLVPAALIGVELETLLNRSLNLACQSAGQVDSPDGCDGSVLLGVILGELAAAGRDKLTFFLSPSIASLGDWIEQLIAESTGKEGQGILPVVGEPIAPPEAYGNDRLFVYLRMDSPPDQPAGENQELDRAVDALSQAGQPVVRLHLRDRYDIGEQFFLWEMATAIAGHLLGINPFDQPNVEAAKKMARRMIAQYEEQGRFPDDTTEPLTAARLRDLVAQASPGEYVAIQAFVQPTEKMDGALLNLRTWIRDASKLATTVGYGPRFLHSTGQLHKGDAGNGVFIQFVSQDAVDLPIPDEAGSSESSITFGILKAAQALGDWQALQAVKRRIVRFDLGQDPTQALRQMLADLA
jgi:transaldolase/glucose-6-phosphate isomerase